MHRYIIAVAATVLACTSSEPAPTSGMRADSAVYAAVLDSLRWNADMVMVVREFTSLPPAPNDRGPDNRWLIGKDSPITLALLTALEDAEPAHSSLEAAMGRLAGVKYVDSTAAGEIPLPRSGGQRLVRFSAIGYSADLSEALLYASMGCGALCGMGSYYVVRRQSDGTWRVGAQLVRFVS